MLLYTSRWTRLAAGSLTFFSLLSATFAEGDTPSETLAAETSSEAPLDDEIIVLDEFTIQMSRANDYALYRDSIALTSNQIYILGQDVLLDLGATSFRDLAGLIPSFQAPARFGQTTLPNIRGDAAELYFLGMRRGDNAFGLLPPLWLPSNVRVVNGPAPVRMGSGIQGGGWIDLEPAIETNQTTVELGRWLPEGRSKVGGKLIQTYRSEDDRTSAALLLQYDRLPYASSAAREDRIEFYADRRFDLTPDLRIFTSLLFQHQEAPQLLGVNRPSQELMDDGIYYTGEPPDTPAFLAPWFITQTDRVTLEGDELLLDDRDTARAQSITAFVELSPKESFDWSLRLLVEGVEREREHAFGYAEAVEQQTVDLVGEVDLSFLNDAIQGLLVTAGINARYEGRESYVDYFSEYVFNFDITDRAAGLSMAERFPNSTFPGRPGPDGRLYFGAEEGSPETTDSDLGQVGVYLDGFYNIAENWAVYFGLRGDGFLAQARDPLPPAGTVNHWEDSVSTANWAGNLEVHYAPPNLPFTLQTRLARAHTINTSVAGGGLMLFNNELPASSFQNRHDLIEFTIGNDADLIIHPIRSERFLRSWRITVYEQNRVQSELRGGNSNLRVRGVEGTLDLYLGDFGALRLTGAWTEGSYRDSAPFQLGGRSLYDHYALGTGPEGRGTGVGFEAFPGANQVPVGNYRIPGLARWRMGFQYTVEPLAELAYEAIPTVRLWGWWEGESPGNLDQEYFLPAQFLLNASLAWELKDWTLRVRGENLLDSMLWQHNGDNFMNNQLLFRLPGRSFTLSIDYRW